MFGDNRTATSFIRVVADVSTVLVKIRDVILVTDNVNENGNQIVHTVIEDDGDGVAVIEENMDGI